MGVRPYPPVVTAHLRGFPATGLAILVGTAVDYLALGYVVFELATRRARRLGVLGDY